MPTKKVIYNLSFTIFLLIISPIANVNVAFAGWGDYNGWHMGPGMMGGWGMGWIMLLFWILVLVGLILIIKWLLQMTRGDKKPAGDARAIDILKERYARGEISKSEFQVIKKDIAN
jgi:putative membrane protein